MARAVIVHPTARTSSPTGSGSWVPAAPPIHLVMRPPSRLVSLVVSTSASAIDTSPAPIA